jgi:hypothetical protein
MSTKLFFAEAADYPQFHAALRSRAEQLNVSREALDADSGLADGYFSKVLQPTAFKGVLTQTALEPVLKALRLKVIVVDDPEAAATRGDLPQRHASRVRLNNDSRRTPMLDFILKIDLGKKERSRASASNRTPVDRSFIAETLEAVAAEVRAAKETEGPILDGTDLPVGGWRIGLQPSWPEG